MAKTLIHVRHALFAYFLQEDTIRPEDQHGQVSFECQNVEDKKALIIQGLKELEVASICKNAGDGLWVLSRPLGMYEQNLSVGYETSLSIAKIINAYCEQVGNTREVCDGAALKERDLQKLVLILESLLQQKT